MEQMATKEKYVGKRNVFNELGYVGNAVLLLDILDFT